MRFRYSSLMRLKEGEAIWFSKPRFHLFWFNQFSLSFSFLGVIFFTGIWAENEFQWSWWGLYLPCVFAILMPLWCGLLLMGTSYMLTDKYVLIVKNYIFFHGVYFLPLKNIWSIEVRSKSREVSVFWGLYERWWSGLVISSSIQRKNEEFCFVFIREADWNRLRSLIPKRISVKFLSESEKA